MTINQPPICIKLFELDHIKQMMVFITQNVTSRIRLYQKLLLSNKNMTITTYKMFDRKMPFSLGLSHGKMIKNPLDIPELRKY